MQLPLNPRSCWNTAVCLFVCLQDYAETWSKNEKNWTCLGSGAMLVLFLQPQRLMRIPWRSQRGRRSTSSIHNRTRLSVPAVQIIHVCQYLHTYSPPTNLLSVCNWISISRIFSTNWTILRFSPGFLQHRKKPLHPHHLESLNVCGATWTQTAAYTKYDFPADKSPWRLTGLAL